ncbi:diguanylate cyclase [Halomonas sp. 18071143]|nr:diguanylate cyclase [Halomonas sp. 18071143]
MTIGVAAAQDGHGELEDLIQRADELLYVGKRAGRDRVVC